MGQWSERVSLTVRLKPVSTFSQNFWQPSCQDTASWEGNHQNQREKLGVGQDGDERLGVTKSCWAPCSSHTWSLVAILLCLVAQSCPVLCDPVDCSPPGSSVHRDSAGKNIGVGCHALLQGIFPTQGSDLHCRQILYQLCHQGNPRILDWVVYLFCRWSSQTRVPCIAGRFFTSWATSMVSPNYFLGCLNKSYAILDF